MKLLITEKDFNFRLNLSKSLDTQYNKSIIFHCYWNGVLNEKHLYSIKSCYYFNIYKRNNKNQHKIILWLENNIENEINEKIKKYAEIKFYDPIIEQKNTFFSEYKYINEIKSYHSDFIRNVLLYNYGGCWFDLDCFFLRNFDPIFSEYGKEICLYEWPEQNYPNNAIYISLEPNSEKMKSNMLFIIKMNNSWGFQLSNLTYDLELDLLILPYEWFDAGWSEYDACDAFFKKGEKEYTFENFFEGFFCFHWHNRWEHNIHEKSILKQLINIIEKEI